ncbi:MAG TPA: thermonuclease family protein [Candidatus Woesebacteria bacterium]|nr:thermonuclease family protein [Candidatus Woesebacteria bacterium]
MKKGGWLILGMLVGVVVVAQVFLAGLRFEKLEYLRMVDGDTFWVRNLRDGSEWRVRLWGVDTPGTKECYSDEATKILEKELTTKKIRYERFGYDSYGRILAKVYVDGVNVEELLVATGAAVPYEAFEVHDKLKPSKEYIDSLKKLEEKAKTEKLGVWSDGCDSM